MSAAHSETFSSRNIVLLGVLLLIAVFVGEVLIGPHPGEGEVTQSMDTVEDIAMRLEPVISLEDMRRLGGAAEGPAGTGTASSGGAAAATTASASPADMYQSACFACHGTGAAGAPKMGDAAAWSERLGKGVDALTAAAIGGIGAMPPRGGSQLDDGQIREVVEYILAQTP